MAKKIENILVVGAGTMGSGIAQVFASNNYKTVMADLKQEFLDTAWKRIDANIDGMLEEDLCDEGYRSGKSKSFFYIKCGDSFRG